MGILYRRKFGKVWRNVGKKWGFVDIGRLRIPIKMKRLCHRKFVPPLCA
jgi:hypothetical protein